LALLFGIVSVTVAKEPANQYEFKKIVVSAAKATEPKLDQVSVEKAVDYLEKGTVAWSKKRNCVSCHTNGSYMLIRPMLISRLGKPSAEMRDFFIQETTRLEKLDPKRLMASTFPARVAYVAAGLASWDRFVTKKRSPETDRAIDLMLKIQSQDGSWGNLTCWPPLESSHYHSATVAATAIGLAPGWLESKATSEQKKQFEQLKKYLVTAEPANDYQRLLLLWTATYVSDLLPKSDRDKLVEMVLKHQQADGGWSIRTFSTPEKWGGGNRAKKLRAEPEFAKPPSDGHQTGLALIVLQASGVPANHPQLQRGADWLLKNQRASGRWWTRSLNTDSYHFITYSGTIYPLLALEKLGKLPK